MKANLTIKGIHCKSCIKLIENELQNKVNEMKIEENGRAFFNFDEKKVSIRQIKETIKKLGYNLI